MKKKILITAVLLFCGWVGMQAQPGTHVHERQHHRIAHGIHKGTLTKQEARHLVAQQRRINYGKRIAKADGRITPREQRILRQSRVKAQREICRKKHNPRRR